LSTQKDKFLASAQKYIQKGQFERALKDYEQVVTADPKDVKHRQKLAELMVRCNRREDAIREYETIAKYYDENGFFLKSIAVYKQIQRLDPSNLDISVALAQLNEKQGLVGNALIEYKTVFDHHQKSGQVDEAIRILEKMKGVDPQNVDIRLKLAETCFSAGQKDKAYHEFTGVANSLRDKGKKEIFDRVCQRIQDIFPDRKEGVLEILASQVKGGQVEESLPKLKKLLDDEPGNTRVMTLLAEAYRVSGELDKCREMLHGILGIDHADVGTIRTIIEIEVEAGSLEEGIALLGQYVPALMEAGCSADVERYYTKLLELAPYDIRILEGLKSLYESTGDQSKLSDVQVSINILSKESPETDAEEPGEAFVEQAWSDAEAQDLPWQDEIDLSFAPEVEPDSTQEALEAGPDLLSPDELSSGSEAQPEHAGNVFDIDISFDLTDMQEMELDHESGAAQEEQPRAAMAISGDADAVEKLEVPDFLEGLEVESDNSPSEDVTQSEDHCIVLSEELPEAEIILEPEPEPETLEGKPVDEPSPGLFEMDLLEEAGDKYSQDGMVSKFKESLESQVDSADTETRYNLGIAYMEMALYDEAIGEFRAARNNPARFLDCITLEGMCCGRKGDFASAEKVFLDALSLEGLDNDRVLSLRYELGVMYESAGNREGALKVFGEIFQASPGFRDTMKKIARLSGEGNGSLDLSDINDADLELDELA